MITMKKKKIIFAITWLINAAYNLFFYQTESFFAIFEIVLFAAVIFSGLFLSEDYQKYVSVVSSRKVMGFTVFSALIIAILGIILHYPANEAKDILVDSISRGILLAIVVYVIRKFRDKEVE